VLKNWLASWFPPLCHAVHLIAFVFCGLQLIQASHAFVATKPFWIVPKMETLMLFMLVWLFYVCVAGIS